MQDDIHIYTDGGCSGNPGPGGWAFVVLEVGQKASLVHQSWGAEANTTNNRMELLAVISAFQWLEHNIPRSKAGPSPDSGPLRQVVVFTDSQYVQKGISQWIQGWKRNGWRTANKSPVKNKDLWLRLDELAAEYQPQWRWVKGHAGNEYNELCDAMTQEAIASLSS